MSRLPPTLKISENDVERGCLQIARLKGYYPVRLHVGTFWVKGSAVRIGEPGLPDYLFVHSRFPGFFLECKRPGKTPDPHQLQKHFDLTRGYRLAVAVMTDPKVFADWIEEHQRKATDLWKEREG